jgi:hypothetical protein
MKKLATSVVATAMMGLGLALMAPAGTASAADVTIDLSAEVGSTTLPGPLGPVNVAVWGYTDTVSAITAPGGPTIEVTEGDTVTVNFTNNLPEPSGVIFRGQAMPPDLTGADANGGTTTYTFTASRPGTYLYEAGLLPGAQYQSSMGLHGALVVNPSTSGQAYGGAESAYDQEAVLVLSEIDPALNNSGNPAAFDMRDFNPKYSLMNGTAYPDTADITVASPGSAQRVLLRYLNAGTVYRSMAALGADQSVIALDGNELTYPRNYVAETFGPGQTADSIVTTPAQTDRDKRIAIYDGSALLHNSNAAGTGGMLTFLLVPAGPSAGDGVGPVSSNLSYSGGILTATVDDTDRGGSPVDEAEYYLDGQLLTDPPLDGTFGTASVEVSADLSAVPELASGKHILYVRGHDSAGNWGVLSSVLVDAGDADGPITRGARLKRNPTNGGSNVKVHATGDDRTTGKSTIVAAEYQIDNLLPQVMNVNKNATVASLDQVIPSGLMGTLTEGPHEVAIRSQDSAGNWGPWLTSADDPDLVLVVDQTAPEATDLSVAPDPNNGTMAINTSTPAVRVAAHLDDPVVAGVNSGLRKAEAFLDVIGDTGKGIQMGAVDGVLDGIDEDALPGDPPGEPAYADIPLATIQQLSNGTHTLYVHAQDGARNWNGTFATVTLTIDKTGPSVSGVSVSPDPTQGAANVSLTATATDAYSAVTGAEWWISPNPGTGNGEPMVVSGTGPWSLTATIDVSGWAPGDYRIRVRAQDALGNWGRRASTVLRVN